MSGTAGTAGKPVGMSSALARRRPVVVGCLPAGFPSVGGGIEVLRAMVDAGVDVIEVEFPYSDPVMDGPVIQAASERALAAGTRAADVLATIEAVAATGTPTYLMTYWNPVRRYGVDAFARDLAAAGGAGLVTPDLLPEEAASWLTASDDRDLDRVFLVSPSSSAERIAAAASASRGFLYATSVMGVTGAREATSSRAPELVARVRRETELPVGVGLGVKNGDQAAAVGAFADAVIVGSAFVSCVLDAPDQAGALRAIGALAEDLSDGVRRSAPP